MEKLLLWLRKEAKNKEMSNLVICLIPAQIAYNIAIVSILHTLEIRFNPAPYGNTPILSWYFPVLLVGAAFVEEIFFRLPLALVVWKWGASVKTLEAALYLSLVFGWLHGSFYNAFVQGVFGFLLCLLFLKCGGMQRKYAKALAVTTFTHVAYNSILTSAALLAGIDKI